MSLDNIVINRKKIKLVFETFTYYYNLQFLVSTYFRHTNEVELSNRTEFRI